MRRAHHALTGIRSASCKNCGEPVLPHHVCLSCGYYRDKKLVAVEVPTASE